MRVCNTYNVIIYETVWIYLFPKITPNKNEFFFTGKMTSPVSVQDDSALSPTSERVFPERIARVGIGFTKLARSPSNGSLNSVLSLVNDSASGEQNFRVCIHCINLLDAREMQKAKQFDKPIICEFYEKMREYMNEASQHLTMYNKMWELLKYVIFHYI